MRDEGWVDQAECRKVPKPERDRIFFPLPSESHAEAQAICAECPVRRQCLDFALDMSEDHGIWGGLSARERRRVAKARRRGLPDPQPRRSIDPRPRRTARAFDPSKSAVAKSARSAQTRRLLTPDERSQRLSEAAQRRWLRDRPIPSR